MIKPKVKGACTSYTVDCANAENVRRKTTPERQKELRRAHARKHLLEQLLHQWLPKSYMSLQQKFIAKGFDLCAQKAFPELAGLFRDGFDCYTCDDQEYSVVQNVRITASKYPPFEEIVRRRRCGSQMQSPYALLRKQELSALCAAKDLPRSGTNEALVKRLEDWDAENCNNFETEDQTSDEVDDLLFMEEDGMTEHS